MSQPHLLSAASWLLPILPCLLLPISFFGVTGNIWQGIGIAFLFGVFCCITALFVLLRPSISIISMPSFAYAGVPLLLVAGVSALQGTSFFHMFFGSGFEFGTIGSIVLFAVIVAVAATSSDDIVALFLYLFEGIGVVIGLFVFWLYVTNGSGLALGGVWSQSSFTLAAAALVAVFLFDGTQKNLVRILHGVSSLVLFSAFLLLFQVGVALICSIVTASAIIYLLWVRRRTPSFQFPIARATFLFGTIFLLVYGLRAPLLEVQPTVRPSLRIAGFIATYEYKDSIKNALIGTGPASFPYVWNAYRPIEMNASPQWSIVPATSYSTVTDIALLFGFLGLAALLYPLLLVAGHSIRRRVYSVTSVRSGLGEVSLALGLLVYLGMFVYPISVSFLLIGGVAFGFFCRQTRFPVVTRIPAYGRIPLTLVVALIGIGTIWVSFLQISAAGYHARAEERIIANTNTLGLLEEAARTWPTGVYFRDAAREILLAAFATISAQQEAGGFIDVTTLGWETKRVYSYASKASSIDSRNADVWLGCGVIYASLVTIESSEGDELARNSFREARRLAPTRPDIPYLEAQFFRIQGDVEAARMSLEDALLLKPDYVDAQNLLRKIQKPL